MKYKINDKVYCCDSDFLFSDSLFLTCVIKELDIKTKCYWVDCKEFTADWLYVGEEYTAKTFKELYKNLLLRIENQKKIFLKDK